MLESLESVLELNTSKNQQLYLDTVLHSILKYCSQSFSLKKFEEYFGKDSEFLHQKLQLKEVLHSSVKHNNNELAKFYLHKKVDPNEADRRGKLPLHYALKNQNKQLVAELAAHGAKLTSASNVNAVGDIKELLLSKISCDNSEFFSLLISANQMEQIVKFQDDEKRNIGHYCVVFKAEKCLKFLK